MQKLLTLFSAKIYSIYAILNDKSFNHMLSNDIISFEQLGPDKHFSYFSKKVYRVGSHLKCLFGEMLPMNTMYAHVFVEKKRQLSILFFDE